MSKICIEIDCSQVIAAVVQALGGVAPAEGTATAPATRGRKKKEEPATADATPPVGAPVAPVPPDSQAVASADGVTIEKVRECVVAAAQKLTVGVVIEELNRVAGVRKAGLVPPEKFGAVIAHLNKLVADSDALGELG
jgi:hypothetical protein